MNCHILEERPIIYAVLTVAVMVANVEGDFRPFSAILADLVVCETGQF